MTESTVYFKYEFEGQSPLYESASVEVVGSVFTMSTVDVETSQLIAVYEARRALPPTSGHMTIRDACLESGFSKGYLRDLCRIGKVDAFKMNGAWLIRRDSLANHMLEQTLFLASRKNEIKELPERTTAQNYPAEASRLREMIIKYFNEYELKALCFDLDIDYDLLSGSHKGEKALALLLDVIQKSNFNRLKEIVKKNRPSISWEDVTG